MRLMMPILGALGLVLTFYVVHTSSFDIVRGTFGEVYNASVNQNTTFRMEYHNHHTKDSVVRVTTAITSTSKINENFPLQIVIHQQLAVQSWNLPMEMGNGIQFARVGRTLCSTGQDVNTTLPVAIEASTFSPSYVNMTVYAELLWNFTVSVGHMYNIFVTPSSPSYYQYTFDGSRDFRSVTLYVRSDQDFFCSLVSIQPAQCPVADMEQYIKTDRLISQTFLQSAVLTISKPDSSKSVYIVFSVSPSDQSCAFTDKVLPIGDDRLKHIEFHIEAHVEDTVYIFALLAAAGYCLFFYVCALLYCIISKCREKRAGHGEELAELRQEERPVITYGAAASVVTDDTDAEARHIDEEEEDLSTGSAIHDADTLDDMDDNKPVYRLKKHLMVSDMSRKGHSALRKKYKLYYWNLIVVSVFYGLPVVQLVLTYQQYLNLSGNQDTCFYNFGCARKLGLLYTFNNVVSNVGYIALGILFIILTKLRERAYDTMVSKKDRQNLGIPRQFGLFYAMGWALAVEGIMSGCYHVCPSNNNFQFDTAFMYILGSLLMLRLFESRHPDINANAHTAFMIFALIIAVAVVGVLFNTTTFWIVFTVCYLLVVLFLSLQIYYAGCLKIDRGLIQSLILWVRSECCKCIPPLFPQRFGLLLVINIFNWALGLFGVITQPNDFATYMLAIIIMNLMGYSIFYVIMKLLHKERIPWQSIVFAFMAVVFWGFALNFFVHNLTDWQKSPAQSRNLNAPCMMLEFFDRHDAWHFLSAGAMFCSFLAVFFVDDHLERVSRDRIPVF